MRILIIALVSTILLSCTSVSAKQNDVTEKKDDPRRESMRKSLHKQIINHKKYQYFGAENSVSSIIKDLDTDPDNNDNLILLYTGRSQNKSFQDSGNKVDYQKEYGITIDDSWNREHVWPKSHGFPELEDTAFTDVHHLFPADRTVNTLRGTRDFDWSCIPVEEAEGCFYDFDSWEPRDEVKGDIARMMFYMTIRYEGPEYDLELVDKSDTHGPVLGKLNTLLLWNLLDPPSEREKARNDKIEKLYQGNRNPFVDHPEYANILWGKPEKRPEISVATRRIDFDEIVLGESKNYTVHYAVANYKSSPEITFDNNIEITNKGYDKLENSARSNLYTLGRNKLELRFAPSKTGQASGNLVIQAGNLKETISYTGYVFPKGTKLVYEENFDRKNPDWTIKTVSGNQSWRNSQYGERRFMKISGYKSDTVSDSWLISPEIDLSNIENPVLVFETAKRHKDVIPGLELYYTTDSNAKTNPESCKWTKLPAAYSEDYYIWVKSGYLEISELKNKKFYLGFSYKSSTPKKSSTWELDNLKIFGNKAD